MKAFLVKVITSVLAIFVAVALCMFIGVVLLVGVVAGLSQPQAVAVPDSAVLVLDMNVIIPDSPQELGPVEALIKLAEPGSPSVIPLRRAIEAIDAAAGDERIKGLLIYGSSSSHLDVSMANLMEVRSAIERFKTSGKPVSAYMQDADQRDYLLASAASDISMHPGCMLLINGFSFERIYFGQAFDRYGVGVQTASAGSYKSATEAFTRSDMSAPDREQLSELLTDISATYRAAIASSRNITPDALGEISSDVGLLMSDQALGVGLIDRVEYRDAMTQRMLDLAGWDEDGETFAQIRLSDYADSLDIVPAVENDDVVAIVYVEGEIVDGEGEVDQAGGDRIARAIRSLRSDDSVRAMVLRVNSPGGSATASEVIRREVELFAKDRPVVVSMGSLAASGGYWVSSSGNYVYASPVTITGSIGVFALVMDVRELADSWGVTVDSVSTSEFADIFSSQRPRDAAEMARLKMLIDEIYADFIGLVSEGRDIPQAQVEQIARGRVWSGADAVGIRLVDSLGGLQDAIAKAEELANLGDVDYSIREVPANKTFEALFAEMFATAGTAMNGPATPAQVEQQKLLRMLQTLNDPKHIYARLPISLEMQW